MTCIGSTNIAVDCSGYQYSFRSKGGGGLQSCHDTIRDIVMMVVLVCSKSKDAR
jgi:hypothetical protein